MLLNSFRESFEDYESDEGYSPSSKKRFDPNEYDPEEAQRRSKLIMSEFSRRKGNTSIEKKLDNSEELILAETTPIKEPLDKKIQNLSLKTRESSFRKLYEYCIENSKKWSIDDAECENFCIECEYEMFKKAKNLIIYQSYFLKKLNEIRKCTNENRCFIRNAKETNCENSTQEKNINENEQIDRNDIEVENRDSGLIKETINKNTFFVSALSILNNHNNEINEEANCEINKASVVRESDEHFNCDNLNTQEKFCKMDSLNKCESEESINQPSSKLKALKVTEKTINLQSISKIVVTILTTYYKNGKFLNKVFACENYVSLINMFH